MWERFGRRRDVILAKSDLSRSAGYGEDDDDKDGDDDNDDDDDDAEDDNDDVILAKSDLPVIW